MREGPISIPHVKSRESIDADVVAALLRLVCNACVSLVLPVLGLTSRVGEAMVNNSISSSVDAQTTTPAVMPRSSHDPESEVRNCARDEVDKFNFD